MAPTSTFNFSSSSSTTKTTTKKEEISTYKCIKSSSNSGVDNSNISSNNNKMIPNNNSYENDTLKKNERFQQNLNEIQEFSKSEEIKNGSNQIVQNMGKNDTSKTTTTISVIAVNSGSTKIVIALLKSAAKIEIKVRKIYYPKMFIFQPMK